ncbi:obscurin-like [Tachysurus fulvidraco]|uniref:obscurin-like n=1 Tax=Tachysurus fulvidraco TaxID=1234273 RepID=UPI001FF06565|nr:obscurin-like [Tachysurus fulvidraco]
MQVCFLLLLLIQLHVTEGRMQVCFLLLLLIQLHVTEGCSLKGNRDTDWITAYTGDSVLLPCSCTELHRKPETFTWKKRTDEINWAQISPESDEYKKRFELVNDHSSGNLSLLISHLTEQDGGDYSCSVNRDEYRYISLTVKGCSLKGNRETEEITAYTGDSVLLPCSCTELQRKPEKFTWERNTDEINWAQISPESDEYKERFQLVNDHSSGNLSLLISHLTEQDGGDYRCDVKGGEYRYVRLTVKGCRLKGNGETEQITAYTGDSVLLPCSCTELHSKPETFIWEKYTNKWTQISPESDEYKERFQLVNDHSSGNLSLLISHLTEQDGGLYRCDVKGGDYRYISLTVKGCSLKGNGETEEITAYTGDSVLLPCSCTELHRKPETFTWKKITYGNNWTQISPESDEYKERFQLVNDHSSGNLSLLISHLTEQDGGVYRCNVKGGEYRDIRLTVKGCSLKGNKETEEITAYTGDSVLLPCSCTELHRKPETFAWEKRKDEINWAQISPESDEYKERFQLVNDHSSGNLSLLISHLTKQDVGVYRCNVNRDKYRDIRLTVKGCSLNEEAEEITAYTGDSVLLPCSCTEVHIKPETFTWEKYTYGNNWTQISPESDEYKERFQLVNDHSSGNLSLLISHLTEQDGGDYRCDVKGYEYRVIRLTVKGCRLKGNKETEQITAYTGDSVLLPCSCTELHSKPETFTWKKYTNNWTQISPESDEYKERFQLVNDHSSGNLSLLISHLTEQDGGVYKCDVKGDEYRYIRLTVKGCRLKGNGEREEITAYTGDSVLLPCSCTELHSKPETFTWEKITDRNNWTQISPESDEYKERFQLVNDHSSGNLSLLISQLTEQDGGVYRCNVKGDEYRYIRLTVKGCSLKGNGGTEEITAYTGDSVLLPCSCTELHRKPETFIWERITDGNNWTQISPESDEYKERFQLVNDHSSGNLSLLISHLTEQDGGLYMCDVKGGEMRFISLTVKGCSLKGNGDMKQITAYTGDSVLLPCSCTELHRKPETFTWKKNTYGNNWTQISPESDEYKERFQLVNDHSSGNLSLLISHLTVEDGGLYRCEIGEMTTDIYFTVKGAPTRPSSSTPVITTTSPHSRPGTNSDPLNTTIIICTAVGVLLLLLILGGVVYWKHRVQRRRQIEIDDGQAGQKKKQNDSDVLYTAMDPKTEHNKEEEQDGLLYSTVVHSNTVRAEHAPVASEEVTVYASIKTN